MDSDSESNSFFLDDDMEYISSINLNPSNIMNCPDTHGSMEFDDLGRQVISVPSDASWCDSSEEYLLGLIEKCEIEAQSHDMSKKYWQSMKHGLAIPSIIVSVVMTGLTDETDNWIQRSAFFTNSLLQGLSYYCDASSKMKLHANARDEFTKIVEETRQILAVPKHKRSPCRDILDIMSKDFRRALSSAP